LWGISFCCLDGQLSKGLQIGCSTLSHFMDDPIHIMQLGNCKDLPLNVQN